MYKPEEYSKAADLVVELGFHQNLRVRNVFFYVGVVVDIVYCDIYLLYILLIIMKRVSIELIIF